jgi:hypothetical protein
MTARNYPLPQPAGDDPRFTFGLVLDVAAVLVRHGYPVIDGVDFVGLRSGLYRFLYAAQVSERDRQLAAEIAERVTADIEADADEVQDEDQPLAARGHGPDNFERHAMHADGTYAPRCGAENATGNIAPFAHRVTCPRCLAMLAEQTADIEAAAERYADDENGGEF